MNRRILLLALLALLAASAEPGARVRVTLLERPEEPVVGTLLALRPGVIEVQESTARTFQGADIARFELSRGMKSRTGRYAVTGALILGCAGALFGVLLGRRVADAPNADLILGGGLGLGGAVIGAGFGAIIGSGTRKEQWETVPVP